MLNLAISLNLLTFSCVLLLVTIPGNEAFSESSSGSAFSSSSSTDPQQPQWTPNEYRPELGVYIGPMLSAILDSQQHHRSTMDEQQQILGHVFAVNESAIQLVNFTFGGDVPDTFFWLDRTEVPTREGIRLRTFEYGLSPIGQYRSGQQILLVLPEFDGEQLRINEFRSLSLFSLNGDIILGITRIPENLIVPRTQLLPDELHGTRYDVQSGPIQILDTRTIKIFGFIFQGDKAPDGYFFVGRGLNVSKEAGVKAAIRGRDTFELISPMNERYTGGKDIYVELPEGHDVQHIDWLSVYCLRFEVDYGHIFIRNISPMIPPFVPPPNRFEEELEMSENKIWHASNLLGTESQLNFTFQLGPPGGKNGYKSIMGVSRPPKFVWYVNGYLAELYLKRGITYTFIVEGGQNVSVPELNNPLYLTDNAYGGYSKLSVDEQRNTRKFTQEAHGRLCRWVEMSDINAETFNAFVDFRDTLRLECDESDQPAFLTFTPGPETPNTLYYASSNNYQMGGRIHVVDQFPADLKDIVVEPYRYDAKRHQEKMELTRENGAQRFSTGIIPIILLNILALSFPFLIIFVLY